MPESSSRQAVPPLLDDQRERKRHSQDEYGESPATAVGLREPDPGSGSIGEPGRHFLPGSGQEGCLSEFRLRWPFCASVCYLGV